MKHYVVKEKDMPEWRKICERYCKIKGWDLLFVNDHSFGAEMKNGQMIHVHIDELKDMVDRESKED